MAGELYRGPRRGYKLNLPFVKWVNFDWIADFPYDWLGLSDCVSEVGPGPCDSIEFKCADANRKADEAIVVQIDDEIVMRAKLSLQHFKGSNAT